MGYDLFIMPPTNFLKWSDEEYVRYFETNPPPDSLELGRVWYVTCAKAVISHHLALNQSDSQAALLMWDDTADRIGWHASQISELLKQVRFVRQFLAQTPIVDDAIPTDVQESVARFVAANKVRWPQKRFATLADLCSPFLDPIETMACRAQARGGGLAVIY